MAPERFIVYSLTGRIDLARMHRAFRAVKRNHGAPGVDGVTIQMFEANLEQNLAALMYDLKHHGCYHAAPLRRVYLSKGNGKWRPLGIPTVRDRVAQAVVRSLLEPIFEPTFAECSFGFRRGRNVHQAIREVLRLLESAGRFVVDADIQSFFDNLPHHIILDRVAEFVADGNILCLLREFLTAGVLEDGVLHPTVKGTPQGGVISPLLANIVLNVLDQRLIQAGFRLVRFADDFVVVCPSRTAAEQALALVSETLQQLGLSLAPDKTRITDRRKAFEFLGFRIAVNSVSVRHKSLEKFKDRVRAITQRSHNLDQDAITALKSVSENSSDIFTIHVLSR